MPIDSARREFAKRAIDAAIRKALDSYDPAVGELIRRVQGRSTLLSPASYAGREDSGLVDQLVRGLVALALRRDDWLRPVDTWIASGRTAVAAFSSLAHHLFARYPVPAVLLSAWFRGVGEEGHRVQDWFHHVGHGGSLRTAGFPLALTKRAAHHFAHAPSGLSSIEAALRWAQVRSLGGNDGFARYVAWTRLGREFDAPEFWDTLLNRLVRSPRLSLMQTYSLIEYLHAHRSVRPDWSLRGSSIGSLLKEAAEWEAEQAREKDRRIVHWPPSDIRPFQYTCASGSDWTIRELLGSDELKAEGKAMRHCVADYKRQCVQRLTTIWSVVVETPEGRRRRRVTVEVDPKTREVVQARAKANAQPDPTSHAVIVQWACREGLKFEII